MSEQILSEDIAPVSVTDERVARPSVWVAALVKTHSERRVSEQLESLSFQTLVAQQEEIHQWSDRKKKVQRIVISNIVFVKSPKERFDELKRYTFVRGLLSNPGQRVPAIIPDEQMSTLRYMLGQSDTPVMLDSARQFHLGGKVRVVRGSLRGLEGVVCRYREGDVHVGVQIPILGIAHIRIASNDIEEIK
ncbi:MAG: UpxY family transcription antiterminator [Bacteroidaceae bacterium]|nr:UpxY family transcription antiterminator [Bacteroidaceae bacterium]